MATILAHLRVHPGREARFEAIAAELYRATHAGETGVRRYEYWRGAEEGTYYSLLSFDDADAFLDHQTSAHHEDASPALGEVLASVRLEWVDPLAEASPLAPTRRTAVADDAPELRRRYARLFAVAEQAWWQPLRT